tara:strand:+ start:511 stop:642 length:132 start_codon:yes stop_codon:yes gene_type:complete
MNDIKKYDNEIDEKTVYFMYGLFWGIILSYYMNSVPTYQKINI